MTPSRWQRLASAVSALLEKSSLPRKLAERFPDSPSLAGEGLNLIHAISRIDETQPIAFPTRLNPGDALASRYRIVELLGRGGMGEVYRAKDETLHLDVAVKVFAKGASIAGPGREVRLGRQLRHRNICQLFDLALDPQHEFLTMEYLRGETLAEEVARGPLSEERMSQIYGQILDGIEAAHKAGVLHGDLKPSNIFLARDPDGSERVVLLDFGLSRQLAESAESSLALPRNLIIGTPAYLAPEQIRGEPLAPTSDLYSLGVILFLCFTGRLPFEGKSAREVLQQRLQKPSPSPRLYRPQLSARWTSIVEACMDPDPARRPGNVGELRALATRRIHLPTRRSLVPVSVLGTGSLVTFWLLSRKEAKVPTVVDSATLRHIRLGQEFLSRRGRDDFQLALEEFRAAVAAAPNSVDALNGLAETYAGLANWGMIDPREGLAKARELLERSLALDEENGLTIGLQGYITSIDVERWLTAEPHFQSALTLRPDDAKIRFLYATHLGRTARHREAIDQLQQAIRLTAEVVALYLYHQLATEYHRLGEKQKFLDQSLELQRLQPNLGHTYVTLARAYLDLDRVPEAFESLKKAEIYNVDRAQLLAVLPVAEYRAGRMARARELGAEFDAMRRSRPVEHVALAAVWCRLADHRRAVESLNEGLARADSSVLTAHVNPWLRAMRDQAEFRAFVARTGWKGVPTGDSQPG